jgi:hypothetical protein
MPGCSAPARRRIEVEALQRFGALLLADLRERTRARRFWVVLGVMLVVAWWCVPPVDAGYRIFTVAGGARAGYSSAWIGLVLAMAFNVVLNLGGFYLVRGTLARDIETRVWQLLVATPMTRGGFLLAKWASHMVVFGLIVALSLGVGLVAQLVRAEDRSVDLFELAKPVLLLGLPGFAFTAMLAVWFDLLPWLRQTAGNIVFFVLWTLILSVSIARMETPGSIWRTGWVSDPGGLVVVARDLQRERVAQTGRPQRFGFSLGAPNNAKSPPNFQWTRWQVRPMDALGRALWLLLSAGGVLLAAPLLDWAAARGPAARAGTGSGHGLRWLDRLLDRLFDRLLAPLARRPLGILALAELRAWLRDRPLWWWLLVLLSFAVQALAGPQGMAMGLLLAWLLPLEILARGALRELERRTAPLVFTAQGIVPRLLAARFVAAVSVLLALSLPAMLRLSASPMAALAVLAICASIASWGLALGALTRNSRLFELLLLVALYMATQGASLFGLGADAQATAALHLLGLVPAWLVLAWAWPRLARA